MNDEISYGYGNRWMVDYDVWSDNDTVTKLRNIIASQMSEKMDLEILNSIKEAMKERVETEEEKVIRILKGDFEKTFGISWDRFQIVYNKILESNPEKLI